MVLLYLCNIKMNKKNIRYLKAIVSSTNYRYKNLNFIKKKTIQQFSKNCKLKYINYKFTITGLKYLSNYNNYKFKLNFNSIIFE